MDEARKLAADRYAELMAEIKANKEQLAAEIKAKKASYAATNRELRATARAMAKIAGIEVKDDDAQ